MTLPRILLFLTIILGLIPMLTMYAEVYAAEPTVKDTNLKVETFVQGLSSPTSMAFLDDNHILVLQKDNGRVLLISNGTLQKNPILQVPVDSTSERGLLGIVVLKHNNERPVTENASVTGEDKEKVRDTVFLYYTESLGDGSLRNRVYSYEWDGKSLVAPKLILDLPALPGPNHDAGKLSIGPEDNLYAIIGELRHDGKLQNIDGGPAPDDTGVILRVNPSNGRGMPGGPFEKAGAQNPLYRYYAYGIRNSFGMAFDPVTSKLWETENGPSSFDEINVIKPGFNGGWKKVFGPIARSDVTQSDLVLFPGSTYYDPVLSWKDPPALTGIEFFNSSKLGTEYRNNLFVGDYNNGNLYFFKLNSTRTGLELNGLSGLSDLVVDNPKELSEITFGTGFGGITDIKTGPDGFLYIVSISDGIIYRVTPVI